MSQTELMGTHTMLTSSELELAERKAAARQVASTSTKANDDTLTIPSESRQIESSGATIICSPHNANSGNDNVVPITSDDTQKSSGPSASSPPEVPLIDATPLGPPPSSPPQVEALGRNHSGDSYRGDPMEPLEYPEAIPPRGENHFLGRFVALFDDKGKLVKLVWVRYRRNLMYEIPSNCPTVPAHWCQVFNQRDGSVIGSLPTPGMRRSVMFPGDKVQSYPEDPSFAERTANYAPSTHRIDPPLSIRTDLPTCGGQVFAGNRIGSTPNTLSFWKKPPASISTRSSHSSTRSDMTRSANAIVPYPQDWGNADAISPQNLFLANPTPVSNVARMPTWSRRGRRGEFDSSDDEESTRSRAARRRPGKPFIPPVTKNMPGGADPYITTPGGSRRPRTMEEVTTMIMVAFKPKLDPKQFLPFKDEGRWIQWWNHFVITLSSQGMGAILDIAYAAREPEEALGFVRMQDYAFGVLNDVIQTPAAKSILRQYRGTRDAREAIAAIVDYYRTSTRALAATHATLRLIGDTRLNASFVGQRQDFLSKYVSYIYDYQEQTTDRPENQLSEPQVINYLQEAVRDDKDLNQLRHREMLRLAEGKPEMGLDRYIEALIDLAILTDQSNPRKNASDGRRSPRSANRLEIGPDYEDEQSSDDDDDSVEDTETSYMIHRVVSKHTSGYISPEKWDKLNVETRNALRAMTPEKRQELYESLREAPADSSGSREVNNTEISASGPEDTTETPKEKVTTDGDLIVQQVIKDMGKAKKAAKAAAQSKKAGNTKSEAHPGDTRKMMSQSKGNQKRSGFTVKWKRSSLPPPTDTELLLHGEDVCGIDEREWLKTKRAMHNPQDPPTPKETWDRTLLIAKDIETRKAVCDELKTEVHLVPPDENNSEKSVVVEQLVCTVSCTNAQSTPITQESLALPLLDEMLASAAELQRHRDSTTNALRLRLPSWAGQEYTQAFCIGCRARCYTEEYCEDCYDLNHYDEDGNTVESIGPDCVPESYVTTFAQMATPSPESEERARRQAYDRKHYLPPSQCHFEDLEFDFRSYHSEDSEDIASQTFPSLEAPDGPSSSSDSNDSWIPPRSSRAANCLIAASRVIMDSGLDMTPLQFLETGLTPDDGEDALIFDTSEDYDDDAHADDTTSERDRYVQEMERLGWDTYPPDASEFDVDQSLYGVRSPAIRRTGHQSFVSRLTDDLADDDESTDETESESEASVEKTIAPRSIYTVTATEPADFFEEYWQTQEYVGDRQFEDYDDWFCEEHDAYDGDRDDGENDGEDSVDSTVGDDGEDPIEIADEDDDEQVFRLGD